MKCTKALVVTTFIIAIILGTSVAALTDPNEVPYYDKQLNPDFSPLTCMKWPNGNVTIGVRGDFTCNDLYELYTVINEWNALDTKVKLNITCNLSPTNVEVFFLNRGQVAQMLGVNESAANMAGCAYYYHNTVNITHSYIYIITDIPEFRHNVIEHELLHAMGLMYHSARNNSALYMYAQDTPYMSIDDIGVVITIYNRP